MAQSFGVTDPWQADFPTLQAIATALHQHWQSLSATEQLYRLRVTALFRELGITWTHPLLVPYCNDLPRLTQLLQELKDRVCAKRPN